MYKDEEAMYPHVAAWLDRLLKGKFPRSEVIVGNTSKKVLSRFLFDKGLHSRFSEYQSYEIHADVTGVAYDERNTRLGLIECKFNKITLRDISQLLGYSKVANPVLAIILSPAGISDSMNLLFNSYGRHDVLSYGDTRAIHVAQWIESKQDIDMQTLIPPGGSLF